MYRCYFHNDWFMVHNFFQINGLTSSHFFINILKQHYMNLKLVHKWVRV